MINIGTISVALSLGSAEVQRVYQGNNLVYPALVEPPGFSYLFTEGIYSSNLALLAGGLWS